MVPALLNEQHFRTFEDVQNGSMNGLQQETKQIYWEDSHKYPDWW